MEHFIPALIYNAALLLAAVAIYDMAVPRVQRLPGRWRQLWIGVLLGTIGIGVMLAHFSYAEGILFDVRSILIANVALFFGWIPTLVVIGMTGVYRWSQGGAGMPVGLMLIVSSGIIGLLWRAYWRDRLGDLRWSELYLAGWSVHVVVAALFLWGLPIPAEEILRAVVLPVLVIYPLVSMLLGGVLMDRRKREQEKRELAESERRYQSLFENNQSVILISDPDTGRIIDANPAAANFYGRPRDELKRMNMVDLYAGTPVVWGDSTRASGVEIARHGLAGGDRRDVEIYRSLIVLGGVRYLYSIVHDVTERLQAELALKAAKEEAEAANQAKSRFLAMMSHEVRTPLNPIIALSEMLLDRNLDEESKEWIEIIRTSAQHLLTLLVDLIDLSKLEAGAVVLERESLSITDVLNQCLEMKNLDAEIKGLRLSGAIEPAVIPQVYGDAIRIRQILLNLIGNAIKFTERGEIAIRVCQEPSGEGKSLFLFEVTDTGAGISEEETKCLFTPFQQVDTSLSRRHEGAGLGLAICRRLVESMGGSIGVRSQPGHGSTFWFRIPLSVASGDRESAAEPAMANSSEGSGGPIEKLRILVVDDDKNALAAMAASLKRWGCTLRFCHSGSDACDCLGKESFDLVLLDLHMPGLNGFETARKIREEEGRRGKNRGYMIAHTADARPETAHRAEAVGLDGVLLKPLSPKRLAQLLEERAATVDL